MTIRRLDEVGGAPIDAPVLVLGAGPAGITVARELAAAGQRCVVAESGERGPSAAASDLDLGEVVGLPLLFEDVDLGTRGVRMRALGGSSQHWTGMCRPLDPIDLRPRAWRPGSGWPIGPEDLAPWYRRAEASLALRVDGWDAAAWHAAAGTTAPLPGERLVPVPFQFSPPVRFGEVHGDELAASDLVDVLLDATAVDLVVDGGGRRVASVVLRSRTGSTVVVDAPRAVVVATGGLEVPRLLLASRSVDPAGVANRSGLVGTGFMEHPHRWAGRAHVLDDPALALYGLGAPPGAAPPSALWLGWSPSAAVQEAESLAHGSVLLWAGGGRGAAAASPTPEAAATGVLLGASSGRAVREVSLTMRVEQLPVAGSTVRLGSATDALGMPRLVLDWRVDPEVDRTMRRMLELLAQELGASGLGRVEVDPGGNPLAAVPIEVGSHPMGTARMHDDPALGVVDADLRCHDVENLFVVGSAVFPTGGHANPTLTIVALAHRLGAHLAGAGLP
jgi:choline dehydrogenase-like flavoprotein